jgi:glycolate oxidase
MAEEDQIYKSLLDIVGENFVSNRQEELYIYSRDSGASKPRRVDYVVMPKTVEEVQEIVKLANKEKIPIVPMGGGLTLSALVVPVRGGIVIDMKRMDKIIEVNEKSRYALIETGVSQGALKSYLEKNHPNLQHSIPDAPPMATVCGSGLIRGYGHLSSIYGCHSEMVNGMEVILPTGEICKIGSCSVSPYWFGRGPLPDLAGLFIGWDGTTGIVTKLSIKIYPKPKTRDLIVFMMQDPDLVPDVIHIITQTGMAENVSIAAQQLPAWMEGYQFIPINITAESEEELEFKKELFKKIAQGYEGIEFMESPPGTMKEEFLELPFFATKVADWKKGGGFEYVGGIVSLDAFSKAWKEGIDIAHRHEMYYSYACRIIDGARSVLFTFSYPFNRADEQSIQQVREALADTNKMILKVGGIPWKAELGGQKEIIKKMDPNTFELMKKIRKVLDPNGIMNPGNWGD